MPWSTITVEKIEVSSQERAALVAVNSSDLGDILDRVVAGARGKILAGGNQVGPAGTVPDQIIEEVMAIVRWKWLTSFPQLVKLQTKEREKQHDDAVALLKDIARREEKVELPDPGTALPTQSPHDAVSVVRPGRCIKTSTFDKTSTS